MIDERLKKIEDVKEQVRGAEAKREEKLIQLGEIAWKRQKKADDTGVYDQVFREIKRLEAETREYSDMMEQIREAVAKKKEIESLRSALKDEMRSLDSEFRGTYEGIGRAASGAYGESLAGEKEISELLVEIRAAEGILSSAQEELERLGHTSGQNSFIGKVTEKGRVTFLKTKIRTAEAKLSRLYRKAGREFCSSGILKRMEDDSLEGLFAPFRTGIEGIAKLHGKEKELVSEIEQVEEDLTHLGAAKNDKKRIGELEQSIEECRTTLSRLYLDAGRLFVENGGKGYEKVSGAGEVYAEIEELDRGISGLNNTITLLETTLQIEGLKAKLADREAKIATAKERIDKLNGEIKEHQKHRKRLQTEIQHLEKTIDTGEAT